jgi:hypothetical protein
MLWWRGLFAQFVLLPPRLLRWSPASTVRFTCIVRVLRVTRHRDREDRRIVITRIGALIAKIGIVITRIPARFQAQCRRRRLAAVAVTGAM